MPAIPVQEQRRESTRVVVEVRRAGASNQAQEGPEVEPTLVPASIGATRSGFS